MINNRSIPSVSINITGGLNMLTVPTSVDQDTYGKAIKHEKTQHTKEPGGQLFPSRCP